MSLDCTINCERDKKDNKFQCNMTCPNMPNYQINEHEHPEITEKPSKPPENKKYNIKLYVSIICIIFLLILIMYNLK